MRNYLAVLVLLALGSLAQGSVATGLPPVLALSETELEWVGRQVFRNECNARVACLVHWNRGESFPSLGIGHFIWYPQGEAGPFVESFPALVSYIQAKGGELPGWLRAQAPLGAPWPDRESFLNAEQGGDPRILELRALLAGHQSLQARFLLERARVALSDVIEASGNPVSTRGKIRALAGSPGGAYALIDYVNFKGEGLSGSERYQGVGWGLLQVLEAMQDGPHATGGAALDAFRTAAARVLTRRAQLSERSIEREQWLGGWLKRVDSYREPVADGS